MFDVITGNARGRESVDTNIFTIAFDKAPHKRFSYKLASHGIFGNAVNGYGKGCEECSSVLS